MDLLITEDQYNRLILENHYDRNQPYVRTYVFDQLRNAPGFIKSHLKGLPRFYVRDEQGNPYTDELGKKIIFTTIPEIIYDYLHGRF